MLLLIPALPEIVWIPSPTKQGLKPLYNRVNRIEIKSESLLQQNKDWNGGDSQEFKGTPGVWIPSPTKQGLKHQRFDEFAAKTGVWIPSPTKQGLKPERSVFEWRVSDSSESLLQQNKDWNRSVKTSGTQSRVSLNPFSNKTRIETKMKHIVFEDGAWRSESLLQQNKDWNIMPKSRQEVGQYQSESLLQQNKDWNSAQSIFNV